MEASAGKLKLVIEGPSFYAGGHYTAQVNEDFAALHALLKRHEVAIVMAGDTRDRTDKLFRILQPFQLDLGVQSKELDLIQILNRDPASVETLLIRAFDLFE